MVKFKTSLVSKPKLQNLQKYLFISHPIHLFKANANHHFVDLSGIISCCSHEATLTEHQHSSVLINAFTAVSVFLTIYCCKNMHHLWMARSGVSKANNFFYLTVHSGNKYVFEDSNFLKIQCLLISHPNLPLGVQMILISEDCWWSLYQ